MAVDTVARSYGASSPTPAPLPKQKTNSGLPRWAVKVGDTAGWARKTIEDWVPGLRRIRRGIQSDSELRAIGDYDGTTWRQRVGGLPLGVAAVAVQQPVKFVKGGTAVAQRIGAPTFSNLLSRYGNWLQAGGTAAQVAKGTFASPLTPVIASELLSKEDREPGTTAARTSSERLAANNVSMADAFGRPVGSGVARTSDEARISQQLPTFGQLLESLYGPGAQTNLKLQALEMKLARDEARAAAGRAAGRVNRDAKEQKTEIAKYTTGSEQQAKSSLLSGGLGDSQATLGSALGYIGTQRLDALKELAKQVKDARAAAAAGSSAAQKRYTGQLRALIDGVYGDLMTKVPGLDQNMVAAAVAELMKEGK